MRKFKLLYPCFILALFSISLITACKKSPDAEEPRNAANEMVIAKVKLWLDDQKKIFLDKASAKIDSLKESLEFNELHLEKYRDSEEFIVVPVSNSFKSKNNSDKNPVNYLVLVLKNQDSITKGNIIQYISSSGQNKAPQNIFFKIFTFKDHDYDGQLTILSIADDFRYELKFENGKLKSVADLRSKNKTQGRTEACLDWWLVTTSYYTDGSWEQTWDYMYTTCDTPDECQATRIAYGRSFRIDCGGGGSNDIVYDEIKILKAECTKTVYYLGSEIGGGTCTTFQMLTGRFHKVHTENDEILSCYLVRSDVNSNSMGAHSLIKTYYTSYPSNTSVTVSTTGQIVFPDNSYINFDKTYTINIGDLAWHN